MGRFCSERCLWRLSGAFLSRGGVVATVTVSSKYQIVIPKEVREALGVRPGAQFQALAYQGRIHLFPIRPIREFRGFLKGMIVGVGRSPDRV